MRINISFVDNLVYLCFIITCVYYSSILCVHVFASLVFTIKKQIFTLDWNNVGGLKTRELLFLFVEEDVDVVYTCTCSNCINVAIARKWFCCKFSSKSMAVKNAFNYSHFDKFLTIIPIYKRILCIKIICITRFLLFVLSFKRHQKSSLITLTFLSTIAQPRIFI